RAYWTPSSSSTNRVDSPTPYGDIELYVYAKYNKYNITFFSSYGIIADSRPYTVGQTVVDSGGLPALTLSSDYSLVGWFTEPNGQGVEYLDSTELSVYENVTLYAYVRYNQ
ncbi:MAG: InlB B-repeat-containing protein, partial [Firmicutes bacterium]|nr:InlB B-repeat-containing protein [Bacillota bacterium]